MTPLTLLSLPFRRSFVSAVLLVMTLLISAKVRALEAAPDSIGGGWIRLFDGNSRFGWSSEAGEWQVNSGALVSDASRESRLRTNASFSNFELKVEARSTGRATLRLRVDPQTKPAQTGDTLSLADGKLDSASGSSASVDGGAWHNYSIHAEDAHLTASVDGAVTADLKDSKNRIGYFEVVVPQGSHLEVRSITLKLIGMERIFNGSNLDGWRAEAAPAPEKSSKMKLPIPGLSSKPKPPKPVRWSGDGLIHGEGGEGQLTSTRAYDDFILQFTAKSSGENKERQAATEMFFRGTQGQYGSGYAVNLATSAKDAQSKHGGLGSVVDLEKSRGASVAAGQLFSGTIVARAHRISIWIDGLLVTDYYDSRPEGVYHSVAGPLGLRVQNEHAVLDLTDIEAMPLPKGPEPAAPPAPVPPPVVAPAASVGGAVSVPAPTLVSVMPSQSPEEKAKQEQVRSLTMQALDATNAADAVRINKQILVLDPGDMPAQQRLDKAQAQVETANLLRDHGVQAEHDASFQQAGNESRRIALLAQTQDALMHGHTAEARDRLNDAERLGAQGPEVEHLQSVIHTRLRNRLLLWCGVGGFGVFAIVSLCIFLWRRRRQVTVAYLIALDGPDKGKRYLLNQEITHIGGVALDGGKKNEILVRDPDRLVSRFHCEVHKRDSNTYVIDLDSSNGTFLNQRKLTPGAATRLRNGDRIGLAGAAVLKLHLERNRSR